MELGEADKLLLEAECMLEQRRLNSAKKAFERAERLGASVDRCAGGRWMAAMLGGSFEAAWLESDAIRARHAPDPHRYWQREELRGAHVIVRCLHGLGDAVQMLRYAPLLAATAAHVIFEAPPRFLPLAPYFRGVREVISWDEHAPAAPPAWDVQVEVMELPYIFRTTLSDLPVATNYLQLPSAPVRTAATAIGATGQLRVGLVWAAARWNPERSLAFSLFEPLLHDPTAEFWNLQGGEAALDVHSCLRLRNANQICGDGLLPLAAAIANMDLVITVDTLAAHLAGAIGKPVWVLLQHASDWRWMVDRDDSPWYPTVRLFRQRKPGDWTGVIDAVRESLSNPASISTKNYPSETVKSLT